MKLLTADRTALANKLRTLWDSGNGPVTIKFYDGAAPAGGPSAAVTTQVLLGTLTCTDPLGSEANGVLTFDPIAQDNQADASGTAGWARLVDGDGNARADFTVTNTAGTGEIKLNTVTIVKDGPIAVTAFTITIGG